MEPPVRTDSESIRDEKVKVLKAIPPIQVEDVVCGQFRGYRNENGVSRDSRVETFAALRVEIDSWRWKGVPFYIRAGKYLPVTATEVLATFCEPPTFLRGQAPGRNYLRFRIGPEMEIAIGTIVMRDKESLEGHAVEMLASRRPGPEEMEAYERVLGDAMTGDSSHFAREDYVEESWRIVEPILKNPPPIQEYDRETWGPQDESVSPAGGWHNPNIITNQATSSSKFETVTASTV